MWMFYFLLIAFGGAILFAIFKGLFEDNALRNFIIFIGIIIAIVGVAFIFNKDDLLNIIGYIILTLVFLISIIVAILVSKAKKQLAEEEKNAAINKKIENEKLNRRKFYEHCKKDGIEMLSTESQKQRAILLAKEYGIDENNIKAVITQEIESIFAEENAEKLKIEKEKNDKIQKQIDEKYNNDANEQQKMLTYYSYYGQEKRIAFWQEKIDECDKLIAAFDQEILRCEKLKDAAINSNFYESKVDWAVAGGIASAIGGAGAGVMAALDAQAKNEEIEARNAVNTKRVVDIVAYRIKEMQRFKALKNEQIDIKKKYEEEIKAIKLKLVDGIKCDNPFDLLKVHIINVSQKTLEIELSLKEETMIFGDVKAVIDGAFWAHIYQEKDYVGSVRVILPYEGIDTEIVNITVDTSLGIKPNEKYYTEYEAEKLWLIEK